MSVRRNRPDSYQEHYAAARLPALVALAVLLGMQLIRVLIPTIVFYLRDSVGMDTLALVPIALGIFSLGFLAGPLRRLAGLRLALNITTTGLAVVRVAEQLTLSPRIDLYLSAAGVALFLMLLPLGLGAARSLGVLGSARFGFGLLLGAAGDAAINILYRTYDLSWQTGTSPVVISSLLAAALMLALLQFMNRLGEGIPIEGSWRESWCMLGVGPWLFLQLVIFQNTARTAALAGWRLPAAGFLVILGNVAGLSAAGLLLGLSDRSQGRWTLAAGILLLIALLPFKSTGLLAVAQIFIGQVGASFLLMRIMVASSPERGEAARPGLARTTVTLGISEILFVLLAFVYYAAFDVSLGFRSPIILPLAGLILFLPSIFSARPGLSFDLANSALNPAVYGLALLLAPLALWLTWHSPQILTPPDNHNIRVMTYNLHDGFNTGGRLDLEALAEVIENSGAQVVALQEISRGWLINGSVDMLSWLSQRLNMASISGPTADPQWGNAILTRFPVAEFRSGSLPPDSLLLRRGYILAEIRTGAGNLRLIATHLHHIEDEGPIREQQVPVLINAWGGAPRTVLMGDFNATPADPEIQALYQAGLLDVSAEIGPLPSYTYYSTHPEKQLDYIWASPDLRFSDFEIPQTTASDHLPLVTTIVIP